MRVIARAFALASIVLGLNSQQASAAALRVLAQGAAAPALHRIIPEFERTTDYKVVVWVGPPAPIHDKVMSGEAVDALFVNTKLYGELLKKKMIEPGFIVGRFGIGIGMRKGATAPDVSTTDALKATLLAAQSIGGLPDNGRNAVGAATANIFRRLGIADQLAPKYHVYPNGQSIVQALVKGEIELGISVVPDMAGAKEIDYAGPLPAPLQMYLTLYGTVRSGSANEAAARSFTQLLHAKATPEFLKQSGLLPAQD